MQLPSLASFTVLQRLELSYNGLRTLAPVAQGGLGCLRELYAASNKLTGLEVCQHLGCLTPSGRHLSADRLPHHL